MLKYKSIITNTKQINIFMYFMGAFLNFLPVESILRDVLADIIGREVSYRIAGFGH